MVERNQNIEFVRILAAFGIVLFHSGAMGAPVGYAGLISFAALSTYFASANTKKLASRILIPWIFWTIFYLGWRMLADGNPFHEGLNPVQSILFGTHLWYLPFIFFVILLFASLPQKHLPILSAIGAFILLAASPWWREFHIQFDPPIVQWLHALPAALLGVACRSKTGMAIAAAGLVLAVLWQIPGVSIPYALGGGAVIIALLLPKFNFNVGAISACMFGTYLVHIAALGVFNRLTGPAELASVCLAFTASTAGVWLARKYVPLSRRVLG